MNRTPISRLALLLVLAGLLVSSTVTGQNVRAGDLGIPFEGVAGPLNAITDVPGVEVGHATIIRGNRRVPLPGRSVEAEHGQQLQLTARVLQRR